MIWAQKMYWIHDTWALECTELITSSGIPITFQIRTTREKMPFKAVCKDSPVVEAESPSAMVSMVSKKVYLPVSMPCAIE